MTDKTITKALQNNRDIENKKKRNDICKFYWQTFSKVPSPISNILSTCILNEVSIK